MFIIRLLWLVSSEIIIFFFLNVYGHWRIFAASTTYLHQTLSMMSAIVMPSVHLSRSSLTLSIERCLGQHLGLFPFIFPLEISSIFHLFSKHGHPTWFVYSWGMHWCRGFLWICYTSPLVFLLYIPFSIKGPYILPSTMLSK